LNQRITKTVNGITTTYVYGLNGELLAELDPAGVTQVEYYYLNGVPVAVSQQGNVYYLHTDQLGTPRTMTDATQKVVWRWDSDPFGVGMPNDDPDGDGVKVTMNLRFAGQYFDQESGLHYNYHRYYDPQMGRYVTSDPIGLKGGLNTFGYVGGNPIGAFDLFGLCSCDAAAIADAATARVGEGGWGNPGYRGGLGWMTEYKCNLFVNTVVAESGSTPPLVNNRQAVAGELANPATNIPNWPVVTTGPIKPGDIVAVGHNGTGYTGHTGIVIQDPELGTSTASASSREAKVNITHFGLEPGSTATIRRCECE
ncbi:MAG: RHS domain-containing protein, partial [Gammaproteobacteria bacterium]|nr:RHS domain-containing protein [Gammaproteobacteria bacterium]